MSGRKIHILTMVSFSLGLMSASGAFAAQGVHLVLRGAVDLQGPVDGAQIAVQTLDGKNVYRSPEAVSEHGRFDLDFTAPDPSALLRVFTTGGTDRGKKLKGHLAAVYTVEELRQRGTVQINALSTLVHYILKKNPGLNLAQAEERVTRILALPDGLTMDDAIAEAGQETVQFSPARFFKKAREMGGVDALLERMAALPENRTMVFAGTVSKSFIEEVGTKVFTGLLTKAAGAGVEYIFNGIMTAILGAPKDPTLEELKKINDRLDQVTEAIGKVEAAIGAVRDDLSRQMGMTFIKTLYLNKADKLYDAITTIQTFTEKYINYASMGDLRKLNRSDVEELRRETLSPRGGPLLQINLIYSNVMGNSQDPIHTSVLYLAMQDAINQGKSFEVVEQVFLDLFYWQMMGASLVTDAYTAGGDQATGQNWLKTQFMPKLQAEIALYQRLADNYSLRGAPHQIDFQTMERSDRLIQTLTSEQGYITGRIFVFGSTLPAQLREQFRYFRFYHTSSGRPSQILGQDANNSKEFYSFGTGELPADRCLMIRPLAKDAVEIGKHCTYAALRFRIPVDKEGLYRGIGQLPEYGTLEARVSPIQRESGAVPGSQYTPPVLFGFVGRVFGADEMRDSYNLVKARGLWGTGLISQPFCRQVEKTTQSKFTGQESAEDFIRILVTGHDSVTMSFFVDPGQSGEMKTAKVTNTGFVQTRKTQLFARREEFLLLEGDPNRRVQIGKMWEDRNENNNGHQSGKIVYFDPTNVNLAPLTGQTVGIVTLKPGPTPNILRVESQVKLSMQGMSAEYRGLVKFCADYKAIDVKIR